MNDLDPSPAAAATDVLAQLRGYRLPEPVGWWPPAPGWWLLVLLAATGLALVLLRRRRRRARTAAARQAQRELLALRRQIAVSDSGDVLRRLSALLRRFAVARWPSQQVAGLTGEAWLRFLDHHGGDGRFRQGPGRHLLDAPYRPRADAPTQQIADLVERWIRHNREMPT